MHVSAVHSIPPPVQRGQHVLHPSNHTAHPAGLVLPEGEGAGVAPPARPGAPPAGTGGVRGGGMADAGRGRASAAGDVGPEVTGAAGAEGADSVGAAGAEGADSMHDGGSKNWQPMRVQASGAPTSVRRQGLHPPNHRRQSAGAAVGWGAW